MTGKLVDFESRRLHLLHKRKEAKVDALRRAFRSARGEPDPAGPDAGRKRRGRKSKTSK